VGKSFAPTELQNFLAFSWVPKRILSNSLGNSLARKSSILLDSGVPAAYSIPAKLSSVFSRKLIMSPFSEPFTGEGTPLKYCPGRSQPYTSTSCQRPPSTDQIPPP